MHFIHEFGFDAKEGKSQEFQKWLVDNEEKLALECPAGCKYDGTYAAIQTTDKTAGSFRTVFRLENYAAQDAFSAAMKEGGTFGRLMEELTEFIDQANHSNWSQALLRRATDAAIWGE